MPPSSTRSGRGPNGTTAANDATPPAVADAVERRRDRPGPPRRADARARRPHPLHPSRLSVHRMSGDQHARPAQLSRHRLDAAPCPADDVATAPTTGPPAAGCWSAIRCVRSGVAAPPRPPTTAPPSPTTTTPKDQGAASWYPRAHHATCTPVRCSVMRSAGLVPSCAVVVAGQRDHEHHEHHRADRTDRPPARRGVAADTDRPPARARHREPDPAAPAALRRRGVTPDL